MAIYGKVALQLLVDQINKDNPQLPFPLNVTDYTFGVPAAVTPVAPDYRNTSITVTPKRTAPYIGAMPLTYRRLDLAKLWNGVKLEITRYINPSTTVSLYNHLLALFNEKYGTALTQDDLNEQTFFSFTGGGSGLARTVTSKGTSYFCTGSIQLTWNQGKQMIGQDVLTVTDISGRLWPNGNNFSVSRTKTAEFFLADQDFTDIAATCAAVGTSGVIANTANWQTIFGKIKEYTGVTFDITNSAGGVNGKAFRTITPPSTTYPDITRPGFNRCLQVDFSAAGLAHGYQGMMNIYYNV